MPALYHEYRCRVDSAATRRGANNPEAGLVPREDYVLDTDIGALSVL